MTDSDEAPKSAIELAMARLKAKDREDGVEEKAVTEAQREAIAEARRVAEARMAECEILYQSRVRAVQDPDAFAVLEEEYRRDRERIASDRDRKIEAIRTQG